MKLKGRGYSLSCKPVVYVILALLIFGVFFSTFAFVPPAKKAHAAGTTYYVDVTGGLDTNSGTDSDHAWQTINKINISSFSPGDTILFKRGQTLRETLKVPSSGTNGNPITFGAYGSGANPLVNGADIITAGSWSKTTGTSLTPIYSVTFTTEVTTGTRNYRQIIPGSTITGSASTIRVTFKAAATAGGTIEGAGIGVRNGSTANITGSVTRVTFGGSNTISTSANQTVISDDTVFSVTPGTDYIVTYYTTNRSTAMRYVSDVSGYVKSVGPDESQTSSVSGYTIDTLGFVLNISYPTSFNNTYQTSQVDPAHIAAGMVWENGARLTAKTTAIDVENTAGSFWWDQTNDILYAHAPDNSNPGSNGKTYEVSMRTDGVIFGSALTVNSRSYIVFQDINVCHTQGDNTTMGGIVIQGAHNVVQRVAVYQTGRHNISFYNDASYSLVQDSVSYEGWDSSQLCTYGPSSVHDNIYRRVIAYNGYQTGDPAAIVISHNASGSSPYNLTIENSEFYNSNVNQNIKLMQRYSNDSQIMTGIIVRNNKFHGYASDAISFAYTSGAQIYGNIFIGDGWSENGIKLLYSTGVQIYNNTFYSTVAGYIIHLSATSTGALIKNNIINGTASYLQVDSDSETGIATDYNDYYNGVASPFSWGGTTYNLANWKTNSSQDAHSLNSDPVFINAGTDFNLLSTSPAIDAGVDLNINTDYAGKQRYDDPDVPNTGGGAVPYYDIGAYEYVTPPNPVLASTACPSQNDYCSSPTPDIRLSSNTSSTTTYNFTVDQTLAPAKATVEAGTADADGSFTVPAGAISTNGTWYVHVITKNLDNDSSANYGTYTIKYAPIQAPVISNTSPVMKTFDKAKVTATDKFKESLKQAKEVLKKSLKEAKNPWQKKQALIIYTKTIIKAISQRQTDLNQARRDYLNNVRRVVLERQTLFKTYNQSIQLAQTNYRTAINTAYQTYRNDLKNASSISQKNQITRTLSNFIHQALLDLRATQSSTRTIFLDGMAKTR